MPRFMSDTEKAAMFAFASLLGYREIDLFPPGVQSRLNALRPDLSTSAHVFAASFIRANRLPSGRRVQAMFRGRVYQLLEQSPWLWDERSPKKDRDEVIKGLRTRFSVCPPLFDKRVKGSKPRRPCTTPRLCPACFARQILFPKANAIFDPANGNPAELDLIWSTVEFESRLNQRTDFVLELRRMWSWNQPRPSVLHAQGCRAMCRFSGISPRVPRKDRSGRNQLVVRSVTLGVAPRDVRPTLGVFETHGMPLDDPKVAWTVGRLLEGPAGFLRGHPETAATVLRMLKDIRLVETMSKTRRPSVQSAAQAPATPESAPTPELSEKETVDA